MYETNELLRQTVWGANADDSELIGAHLLQGRMPASIVGDEARKHWFRQESVWNRYPDHDFNMLFEIVTKAVTEERRKVAMRALGLDTL